MKTVGYGILTYKDKTYTKFDITETTTASQFGLLPEFYGGRVKLIGKVDNGVYMCLTAENEPIDLIIKEETQEQELSDAIVEIKEEPKEDKFICSKCGKEVKSNAALRTHERFCKYPS